MYNELIDESIVNINQYKSLVVDLGAATEDWSAALQQANDDIVLSGMSKVIAIPQNIQIRSGVVIDTSRVSLRGNGISLTADIHDLSVYAITATSSDSLNNDKRSVKFIDGIKLFCKELNTCNGIKFENVANLTLIEMALNGFHIAEDYKGNTLGINHYNCAINGSYIAINVGTDLNAGRRIEFNNSNIYNNSGCTYIDNPTAHVYFISSNIDFNSGYGFDCRTGKLFYRDCHIEHDTEQYSSTHRPFMIGTNGLVEIRGGNFLMQNSFVGTLDYLFDNSGSLLIKDVTLFGCSSVTGRLATGSGNTKIEGITSTEITNSSMLSYRYNNLLCSGEFEDVGIADDFYITEDTIPVAPHSRTGRSISLETSTDVALNYNRSLKVSKLEAGTSSFMVTVPMEIGSIPYAEFNYFKVEAGLVGNMGVSFGFCKKNEVGALTAYQAIGSSTINFTSATVPWTVYKTPVTVPRVPYWATHFYMQFSISNLSLGHLYIDDFIISRM